MPDTAGIYSFTVAVTDGTSVVSRAFVLSVAGPTTLDLTAPSGAYRDNQSFNETRAIDVEILAPGGVDVQAMTLRLFNVGSGASGTLGARIYSSTGLPVASADQAVPGGFDQAATIPISAHLASGESYRIGFYLVTTPPWQGSIDGLDAPPPGYDVTAYADPTGAVRVLRAWAVSGDAYPTNPNTLVPFIELDVAPVSGSSLNLAAPNGTVYHNQSFNETRAVEVEVVNPGGVTVQSMTLDEFNVVSGTGTLGARIYSSTGALVASADQAVGSGFDLSATVPISASLSPGETYRLGFYLVTDPLWKGSIDGTDAAPPGFGLDPYTDATGSLEASARGPLAPTRIRPTRTPWCPASPWARVERCPSSRSRRRLRQACRSFHPSASSSWTPVEQPFPV